MKIISKIIAVTLSTALVSTSMLPVTAAHAHDTRKWHKHSHHNVARHHKQRRSSKGDKIAAGILGFALGALLVSEANKRKRQPVYEPTYRSPRPIYREPAYTERDYDEPIYDDRRYVEPEYRARVERRPIQDYGRDAPKVITYDDAMASNSYEPWSTNWANYCRAKYRSFNINTGTFRGYDGEDHFCVVK